jgi:hypothetical protein
MLDRARKLFSSRRKVRDDWSASLPDDRNSLFETITQNWDTYYHMLSVALDEALSLRRERQLGVAQELAATSSELMSVLAANLVTVLLAMNAEAQHFPVPPSVEPLNPAFFRWHRSQESASWNSLLFHVLLGHRSRFFHKVQALIAILEAVGQEFSEVANDIAEQACMNPEESWSVLDCLHYDANTCLRESEVLLKSLLHVWPAKGSDTFVTKLTGSVPIPEALTRFRVRRSAAD